MADYIVPSETCEPVAEAAEFYRSHIAPIQQLAEEHDCVTVIFGGSDKARTVWRRAAIESLAREQAPKRINGISGGQQDRIMATSRYLASAHGITGQVLLLSDSPSEPEAKGEGGE